MTGNISSLTMPAQLQVHSVPMAAIAAAGGPTKVIPASWHCVANDVFSDKKPYPGCMALAPVLRATCNSAYYNEISTIAVKDTLLYGKERCSDGKHLQLQKYTGTQVRL